MLNVTECKIKQISGGCRGFNSLIYTPLISKYLILSASECKTLVEEKTIVLNQRVQKVGNLNNFVFENVDHCAYVAGEVIQKTVFFDAVQEELLLENTLVPLNQSYFVGIYGTTIWS